ncbi:MAG: hypothetical protein ACRELS_06400 [Candidatus Rokuibacteriota bacterium]
MAGSRRVEAAASRRPIPVPGAVALAERVGDLRRLIPPLRWIPRSDETPPLVRGLGPTLLPRPQRLYFHFGTPVGTRHLTGLDDHACGTVRDQVRVAVETGIAFLLHERARDPQRSLLRRLPAA